MGLAVRGGHGRSHCWWTTTCPVCKAGAHAAARGVFVKWKDHTCLTLAVDGKDRRRKVISVDCSAASVEVTQRSADMITLVPVTDIPAGIVCSEDADTLLLLNKNEGRKTKKDFFRSFFLSPSCSTLPPKLALAFAPRKQARPTWNKAQNDHNSWSIVFKAIRPTLMAV